MWAVKVPINKAHFRHDGSFKTVKDFAKGMAGGINFGFYKRTTPPKPEGAVIVEGKVKWDEVVGGRPSLMHVPTDPPGSSLRIQNIWNLDPRFTGRYRILAQAGPWLVAAGDVLEPAQYGNYPGVSPLSSLERIGVGLLGRDHLLIAGAKTTLPGLGRWFKDHGAAYAMACDGGSSAGFFLDGEYVFGNGGALVPNALVFEEYEVIEKPDISTPATQPGVNFKLTENFSLLEFKCPHCSRVKLSPGFEALVMGLQGLRSHLGKPVIITSGYRCPEYNATLEGAAPASLHVQGIAADIYVPGLNVTGLTREAITFFENGGIGVYPGHIHVDVGPRRRW